MKVVLDRGEANPSRSLGLRFGPFRSSYLPPQIVADNKAFYTARAGIRPSILHKTYTAHFSPEPVAPLSAFDLHAKLASRGYVVPSMKWTKRQTPT